MDELLWVNHDVDPPVVGSDCADVVKPASTKASPPAQRVPTRPSDTPRTRKRQRDDDHLDYLERSDSKMAALLMSPTVMMALKKEIRGSS
ncbi:unnamed protein product [Arctogadus glacialis]